MSPDRGFTHLGDREVAQLDRIRVVRGRFRGPDGVEFERDVVRNQQVVAMVPVEADRRTVILVRQYRGPIDGELLEIPAGLCDVDGEALVATARRELIEEIGVRAGSLEQIARFHPAAGFSDQLVHLFLATDLEVVGDQRQGIEEQHMTVERVDLDEVPDLIARGVLIDSKTLIGLLLARSLLR